MIEIIARNEARARALRSRSPRMGLAIVEATGANTVEAWRAWGDLCAAIEAGDEDRAATLGVAFVDALAAASTLTRHEIEKVILGAGGMYRE